MKILYLNKTKYTKKVYQEYLNFHQSKYGTKHRFTIVVTILLLLFCITITLKNAYYTTTLAFIICLTIFCLYQFYYPPKKIKKELKTEKFQKEKEFTFTFYENHFTISNQDLSEQIKYKKLYKIYETENFFYLYINKDHAFLLDKLKFSKGNISDFLKFLKKKKRII